MQTVSTVDLVLRLVAATVCGAIIGLNRDLRHKTAGLRTLSLVALGASLATTLIAGVTADQNAMSRVIQGVLTGIGFVGAGVILHRQDVAQVTGLTTAAAVWITAALGIACGAGLYWLAITALVLVLLILMVGKRIEKWVAHMVARRKSDTNQDQLPPRDKP